DRLQAPPPGILAGRPLIELDARLRRKHLQGLGEGQPVAAHDEVEDVAALAAAEALPGVARGRDRERWRLLAVEGAQALVRRAGLLQLDGSADAVADAHLVLDLGRAAARQTAPPPARPGSSKVDPPGPPSGAGHGCGLVKS